MALLIRRPSDFLERRPWAAVALIVLFYLPSAFEDSRKTLLWHDELFTYWISQAPTLKDMWVDLRTLDLNPPLGYLLTRFSFYLLGANTLATRLPEILSFLVMLLAIFQFVRHRLGVTYGLFSAALLMQSPIAALSVEARPYAPMLACLGIAIAGWQRAVDSKKASWMALASLFFGTLGMLLSHIFSILAVAALLLAELVRQRRQGSLNPAVLLALLLPLAATTSYIPMLRSHGSTVFPPDFQPSAGTMFLFYVSSIDHELLSVGLTALAVLILFGIRAIPAPSTGTRAWFFSEPEWVLLGGLFLAPLALMTELMLTHGAFFERYGAVETIAVVGASCALLARLTMEKNQIDARPALLGAAIALLLSGQWLAIPRQLARHQLVPTIANSEPPLEPCEACGNTAAIDPTLPLVVASGLTFVEMNHRETRRTLSQVFYLTDGDASTAFAHASIFEHMSLVVERFHLAGNVENYQPFVAAHPHFFVFGTYDYPEDWLLRKLAADRADIRVLDRVDDSYVNREVYEVKIDTAKH